MTSTGDLDTPALVFDLDVVARNIAEMAEVARTAGVGLRPHTKTHKSPLIAGMQIEAGASGITVAKLGEAEVMADAGIQDILIAYPLVGETKLRRLRALMERASITVSLDSVEAAEGVGAAGLDTGRDVPVLVEVDTGHHRMGRAPGEPTLELVAQIARVPGITVTGLLTHAGHAYAAADAADLRRIAEREALDLIETAEAGSQLGLDLREISVGATPTVRIGAGIDGVTEIRPGTYVFNDVQQLRLGVAEQAACGAHVLATVIGRPTAERFVIDAGSKAFSSDGGDGPPFPGRALVLDRPDLMVDFLTEEHGVGHVIGDAALRIGERLTLIPLHVCSAVNLFDVAYGAREGTVERTIPIVARGRSQ